MNNSQDASATSQDQGRPGAPFQHNTQSQPSVAAPPALAGTALSGTSLPALKGLQQLGLSLDDSVTCGPDGC